MVVEFPANFCELPWAFQRAYLLDAFREGLNPNHEVSDKVRKHPVAFQQGFLEREHIASQGPYSQSTWDINSSSTEKFQVLCKFSVFFREEGGVGNGI